MLRHNLIFFFLDNHSEDLLHKLCFPVHLYVHTLTKQINVIFRENLSHQIIIYPFNYSSKPPSLHYIYIQMEVSISTEN